MANEQDERNAMRIPNADSGELNLANTDGEVWLFGHNSDPPRARTEDSVQKQWQPPKNESIPDNRTKKS